MTTTTTQVQGPPSPAAQRLRRPGWRDPRLLAGLALIAASVALGSWLVSAAGRTTAVYQAAEPIVPGEALSADLLTVVEVRLADGLDRYLRADQDLPDDLVTVRTIGAGELVPWSALGDAADLDVRPVAVTPGGPLSSVVAKGVRVDLWFVPEAAPDGADPDGAARTQGAHQLAAGLTVAEVAEPDGAFSLGSTGTVQVLVPLDQLPELLTALSARGSVQVVPVPGTAPAS